jgi:cysteine desulfurase
VLAAMGVETERAKGALRLSLGHTTTQHDVDRAITVVAGAVSYLQEMSERTRARAQSGTQAGAQRS